MDVYVEQDKTTGRWAVDVPSLHAWGVQAPATFASGLDAAGHVLHMLGEPTDEDDIYVLPF